MNLRKLVESLNILAGYKDQIEIAPIPDTFPGGMPKHSNRIYMTVEVEVSDADGDKLKRLGWKQEDEFWVYYHHC
jgi:hypothetical protein